MFDPARYTDQFEREYGATPAEWLRLLPEAVAGRPLALRAGGATVTIGAGELALHWQALPPRRIALMQIPRLQVRYHFSQVSADERARFLRVFDLTMQRGGG